MTGVYETDMRMMRGILWVFLILISILIILLSINLIGTSINALTGTEKSVEVNCYDRYSNEIVEGAKCRKTLICGGWLPLVEDTRCKK